MDSSLPYHEPPISVLLIQSSFILALSAVNYLLDAVIYSGLVGEILVGIAWGTPGGKLLSAEAEEVIVQLGYLGLILLVFEGGLSTSFSALMANLLLSIAVAITGILVPMGLSFVLASMAGASPVQAFAAGAALCSTSLGTTFTLLGTSGLTTTRLGVVLTSAAMMDDVVGLIMVQVVANLGTASSFNAVTVIRPVFVSLAFAIVLPLSCRFVVLPATRFLNAKREKNPKFALDSLLRKRETALVIHTAILVGMVAGATYAGSSSLLGAYIAGATISWWDTEASHPHHKEEGSSGDHHCAAGAESPGVDSTNVSSTPTESGAVTEAPRNTTQTQARPGPSDTGAEIFERYYSQVLKRLLKPFFFASVGFSIPITKMFTGSVVWRGLVYSALMAFGKLLCGLWLLRVPSLVGQLQVLVRIVKGWIDSREKSTEPPRAGRASNAATIRSVETPKPLSIYPGLILGSAMVSRGEIGYLISSLAESHGVLREEAESSGSDEPSELFLIITWAITLCTVAGPVTMGYLVDRVRKLEKKSTGQDQQGRRSNVLGTWGVS